MSAPARFKDLCLDARDHQALADWWCTAMGYVRRDVADPPEDGWVRPEDWPCRSSTRPATGRCSGWSGDRREGREEPHAPRRRGRHRGAAGLGATLVRGRDGDGTGEPTDFSSGAIEWDVLADPEGNEFCVFTPGRHAFPQPD